ncbi:Rrf2 family transcriptional regulator [Methyloligella sp. 2.7D]|uniref:Rrf2 family transcriptional regulator n=1 Tax=unclassified Methyloligella TaxID=2625955 RepID=UPI00157C94CA|nr:Rrf2 family transcriptional regulator [Methyloligella sp. GL2]QKP76986.1 Rrf2 family transcriptional regulator [Methyloligella sp. GL2]
MRLTKQTSYAIRILTHCARNKGKSVRTSDIAQTYGITEYNVAKIVPILVRAGFLTSTRGRLGGLQLAKPADEIHIGDVVRATETTYVEAECAGGGVQDCAIKPAALINRLLGEALEAFISVLDEHTLDELVAATPHGGGQDFELLSGLQNRPQRSTSRAGLPSSS